MPESEATATRTGTIQDLVGDALASVKNRPAYSYEPDNDIHILSSLRPFAEPAGLTVEEIRPSGTSFSRPQTLNPTLSPDPMMRMFGNPLGLSAVNQIGNEGRTLDIIQTLAVDIMLEAARLSPSFGSAFQLSEDMRRLFVPARNGLPPTLLILDPTLAAKDTRRITDQIAVVATMLARPDSGEAQTGDEKALRARLLASPEGVRTVLGIAQPEVVVTRRPVMERICVPSPLLRVENTTELSTVGIYCRDGDGVLGVTACYHGTGPVGTAVTVNGVPCQIAAASETQDIVFIPYPDADLAALVPQVNRVLSDRTPSQYGNARFEGATSGMTATSISSHDAGLLRDRPSLQLKVQTPADTNRGDSGSALIDQDNNVIGFAFEKSAFDETPQITDWIWAANALRSLNLTPA